MRRLRRHLAALWRHKAFLIGPLLLLAVFSTVDLGGALAEIGRAQPGLLLLAFAASLLEMLCKALRWRLLAQPAVEIGKRDSVIFYSAGFYWGAFTPGRLGEFYKVQFLRRKGAGGVFATAATLLDRLLDFAVMAVAFAAIALLLSPQWLDALSFDLGYWSAFALAVGLAVAAALFLSRRWLSGRMELLSTLLGDAKAAGADIRKAKWPAIGVLTGLSLLLLLADRLLLFRAIAGPGSELTVLAAVLLAALLSVLPITVQGVGTRDAVLVFLLAGVGIAEETALALSLLILALILLHVLIGQAAAIAADRLGPSGEGKHGERKEGGGP